LLFRRIKLVRAARQRNRRRARRRR